MKSTHVMTALGKRVATGVLLVSALAAPMAQADFINTDFSAGFSGWEGEVTEYNYDTFSDSTVSGDIFGEYPDNFDSSGTAVTLSTSSDQSADYWNIAMFQNTQLSPLMMGQTLWLSLGVSSSLSDPLSDFFYVQLRDLSSDDIFDLSSGGTFNLSAWAGRAVSFEFGIIDSDFLPEDSLSVSDIRFQVEAASVSEPSALFLAGLGGLFLSWRRARW